MGEETKNEFESYGLHCPICTSQDLQAIVENQNENYWICSRCGHKFRRLQDLENELRRLKGRRSILVILISIFCFAFVVVSFKAFSLDDKTQKIGILYVSGVIFIAATLILLGKLFSSIINIIKCKKELDHVRKSVLH